MTRTSVNASSHYIPTFSNLCGGWFRFLLSGGVETWRRGGRQGARVQKSLNVGVWIAKPALVTCVVRSKRWSSRSAWLEPPTCETINNFFQEKNRTFLQRIFVHQKMWKDNRVGPDKADKVPAVKARMQKTVKREENWFNEEDDCFWLAYLHVFIVSLCFLMFLYHLASKESSCQLVVEGRKRRKRGLGPKSLRTCGSCKAPGMTHDSWSAFH